MLLSKWQSSYARPQYKGWYRLKAEQGEPFSCGKQAWAYWDGANWCGPLTNNAKHPRRPLLGSFIVLLTGDKWQGRIDG